MQDTELVVRKAFCFAGGDFSFQRKIQILLCGNACFGVWPKYDS